MPSRCFFVGMKRIAFLFALVFCFFLTAQESVLRMTLPENLENVMSRKIDLDKTRSEQEQYTVQIFSGNFEQAEIQLARFKGYFPEIEAKLTFETPNYKIRVGRYATRLEGLTALAEIKKKFYQAFLLMP